MFEEIDETFERLAGDALTMEESTATFRWLVSELTIIQYAAENRLNTLLGAGDNDASTDDA